MKRIYCKDLSVVKDESSVENITVSGFCANIRNKGGVIFVLLRDVSGVVQLVFDDTSDSNVFETAKSLKKEAVITASGILRERSAKNNKEQNGSIEIFVTGLKVLSLPQNSLPFELKDEINVNDELRLKYRYLDLRRNKIKDSIVFRHNVAKAAREYFYKNRFIEIETPMFIKSTPEGARDYLVPSRVHPGKFYALPQSPQIYKQLLMVAGFDRYIQLARCFRDEDLRADRQPEFTQIDIEMSFAEVEDVLEIVEGFISYLMKEVMNIDIPAIPRMSYNEAMEKYGTDKPDTRYECLIQDVTELAKETDFEVFKNAPFVKGICFHSSTDKLSRKELDRITEYAKGIGALGLPYIRGKSCPFGKFLKEGQLEKFQKIFEANENSVILFAAGEKNPTLSLLGNLRVYIAKLLGINEGAFNYLWITEMPFFEKDENGSFVAMHHPFTMPLDDCIEFLDTAPEKVYAKSYDLVLNGTELCSGSVRITDPSLQQKMFESLGLSEEEIEAKFGFLVDAYKFASPPHAGAGIGLDRLCMTLQGASSLREVTAFPKLKDGAEPMSGAPGDADSVLLSELGIKL